MRLPPKGEGRRLLIGLLLPHVLVVVPGSIFVGLTNGPLFVGYAILFLSLFSGLFLGIQSLIFTLIMEFAINQNIKSNSLSVLFGGFLGLVSGVPVSFPKAGLAVGLFAALILRIHYTRSVINA